MTTSAPGDPDATGHPEVDRALTSLDGLTARPVDEHLDVLTGVHERLHTALDEHRTAGQDDPAPEQDNSYDQSHPDRTSGHH